MSDSFIPGELVRFRIDRTGHKLPCHISECRGQKELRVLASDSMFTTYIILETGGRSCDNTRLLGRVATHCSVSNCEEKATDAVPSDWHNSPMRLESMCAQHAQEFYEEMTIPTVREN